LIEYPNYLQANISQAHYEEELCLCDRPNPAETFLRTQLPSARADALLICTWGAGKTVMMRRGPNPRPQICEEPAWSAPRNYDDPSNDLRPVDTVGAGDTFIAGMLYGVFVQEGWTSDERLAFANELAGRKVHQEGFEGLGEKIRGSDKWGEKLKVVSAQSSPE
jgi:ketohexokinase